MEVSQQRFGELNGQEVQSFILENDKGMKVTCISYGCIITDILVPDKNGAYENVVLGFDTIEEYREHSPYFGAVIGRVAGRIGGSEFELSGNRYTLLQNEGDNHLHGGGLGFDKVIWNAKIVKSDDTAGVAFSYMSPDGEEGYPGNVSVTVTYTLNNENELLISYKANTDKATLLNLTNHTYFNLSGDLKYDISQHVLHMKSNSFLELNEELLPTGEVLGVEGTAFDFREGRKIEDGIASQHSQNRLAGGGYDHPFLLESHFQEEIVLQDEMSGRKLIIETDQPGVVLYSGNHLEGAYELRGTKVEKYLGLCLETQGLPDAIHHPDFPSIVVEEGETYQAVTRYRFTTM